MKKKCIVIACIVLVLISSSDAADSKKNRKSKRVKNVQSDGVIGEKPQAQQATDDYPENYEDDYNNYDEGENENGAPGRFTITRNRKGENK